MVVDTAGKVSLEELRKEFPKLRIRKISSTSVDVILGDVTLVKAFIDSKLEKLPERQENMNDDKLKQPGNTIVDGIKTIVDSMFSDQMQDVERTKTEFEAYIQDLKEKSKLIQEQTLESNAKTINELRQLAENCLETIKVMEKSFDSKLEDVDRKFREATEKNKVVLVNFFNTSAKIAAESAKAFS